MPVQHFGGTLEYGALLVCMAVGLAGLIGAVCYKRPGILPPLIVCCLPCVAYAVLYLLFD